MKLYTNLDIPIKNWIKIQESYDNGKPELRYLYKNSLNRFPIFCNKKKLYKTYLQILYLIPEMDTELNTKWLTYLIELKSYDIQREMNAWRRAFNKKQEKIQVNKLNVAFHDYLTTVDKSYKEFSFDIFGLKKDFKETWNYKIDIPDILLKNNRFEFFLAEEYINMVVEWIKDKKIDLYGAAILLSKEFYKKYIEKKEVKLDSILGVNKRLFEFFRDTNNVEKWRIIRGDFFNLYKMDFVPSKDNDLLEQVIKLRKINKQEISLNCSLKEFFKQQKVARESQKEAQKNGK